MADPDDEKQARFPVVGIGASAGGLEALEELIGRLAGDSMAFVVLQHLAPDKHSMLAEILARGSALDVVTIVDGLTLVPRTIYVAPPGVDVTVEGGVLHTRPNSDVVPRLPIDVLLRSLAADVAELSVGVILSGSGSDGTLGMRAIKEAGGITFAQQPSTAVQPSMPQAAIDAGCADFVLSPAEIGDELMRLASHPYVARKVPAGPIAIDVLVRLFDLLRRTYGVDFSAYKPPTIERRIQRRMALQKLERIEDYLRLVEGSTQELDTLYSDMLIGVTGFFRDLEPFAALARVVFPRLLERRSPEHVIRIWVPGCSTGEEAYSIAMCLLEVLDQHHGAYKVQVFGTDIDELALSRARLAIYPQNIEADVSAARLQRFFVRVDKGYQVSRQVRDLVVFARHNLGKDPPFSRLDLVSCRNVLIYMQPALQRKLLRTFHYALNNDAFLMLGTSESVGDAADLFTLVDRKVKIYAKKSAASAGVFDFALGASAGGEARGGAAGAATHERRLGGVSVQQLADRKVLDKFGPPGLLIDERMEVMQFRGQIGPFLAPTPGNATLNALKLLRPELLVAVRGAASDVIKQALPTTSAPVEIDGGHVVVDAMPLGDPAQQRRCVLLLFRELSAATMASLASAATKATSTTSATSATSTGASTTGDDEQEARVAELSALQRRLEEVERELLVNKEYLQSTVQELEASNEELQSANEELQSANEELQSSNEELETSKEELQSTNEELATVNEELQNRLAQLSVSNDDLRNVLHDTSVPVVIVGHDLRIRRFSNAAARLLNLIGGDIGRPIAYLGNSLNAPQIGDLIGEAMQTARDRTQRVRCSDGRWYTLRATPYRTAEETIRGAIIELLRSPPNRKAGELPEVHELAAKLLTGMPHARVLLDDAQRIVWANTAFFEGYQLGAEVVGLPLDELWHRGDTPELWEALDRRTPVAIEVSHPFGRERPALVSLQFVDGEGERAPLTMMILDGTRAGGAGGAAARSGGAA